MFSKIKTIKTIQGYTRVFPVFILMSFFLLNISGVYAYSFTSELPDSRNSELHYFSPGSSYFSLGSSHFTPSEHFYSSYRNSYFAPSERFHASSNRGYLKNFSELYILFSDTPTSEGGYVGEGDPDDPNGNGGMIAEATPIADGIEVLILLLFAYTVFLLIRKRNKASTSLSTQV